MRAAMILGTLCGLLAACATRPTEAEIERLAKAANQARETGICNIHHVHMHKELVRVEYAHLPLEYFSSAYHDAFLQSFPNAREYALSLNPAHEGRNVRVFVCPQCKQALQDWLAKHPNDEWGKLMGPKEV